MSLRKTVHFLICIGGLLAALCLANRPRFWWQELFCGAALCWLPLALLALIYLIHSVWANRSARTWLSFGAIWCYVYAVVHTAIILAPYLHYKRWSKAFSSPTNQMSALWSECPINPDSSVELQRQIGRLEPSVLIILGGLSADLSSSVFLNRYPYTARTSSVEKGGILLISKSPFGPPRADDLGIEAFPGGVFVLQKEGSAAIEIGVMRLERSISSEVFERNRVTSRRLASLMRNSDEPRLVVAQFGTTPFSQLMAIYPKQARLRSLMFGMELSKMFEIAWPALVSPGSNIFVSRDFTRQTLELIHLPGCQSPLIFFRVV